MIKLFLIFFVIFISCSEENEFLKETYKSNENVNLVFNDKRCDFSAYKPVSVSHFIQYSLETKYKPLYPEEAAKRSIQGKVSIKILVNGNGDVIKACALDGDEALWQPSEDAALKWKFKNTGRKAYVVDGISFNYILNKNIARNIESNEIYPQ